MAWAETNGLKRALGVYGSPKMGILLLLGFSSGLPLLLINTTLNAWLTQAGLTTIAIGLFNLLNLPYSFKFLWSPFLDRFLLPAPGSLQGSRRRGWMALTQVLLLLSLGLLGFQDPAQTWLEGLGLEELAQTWPGITVLTRPIFWWGCWWPFSVLPKISPWMPTVPMSWKNGRWGRGWLFSCLATAWPCW
ncbi:MAG: hypothetical protein SNJ68_07505 [Cyanobacteriota bacterium]